MTKIYIVFFIYSILIYSILYIVFLCIVFFYKYVCIDLPSTDCNSVQPATHSYLQHEDIKEMTRLCH